MDKEKVSAQEPVAWNEEEFNAIAYAYRTCPVYEMEMVSQRYQELVAYVLSIANNKKWQGLTDDEALQIYIDDPAIASHKDPHLIKYARAIEQALRIKNGT